MTDILEIFQQSWAVRAIIASALVGITCGILGCFIVLRNMALIGDALSHAILPGIVVAFIFFGYSTLWFFIGSVTAGLIAAIGITWIQQKIRTKNDAAIGIVFTAMFSLGVIGISWISRDQGVHLDMKDFLFGNVLGVSDEDLYLTIGVTLYVILSVILFYRYLFITTFQPVIAETMGISTRAIHYYIMLLLSFSVVASLRTVGVILVVAMLITPASTALLLSNRLKKVVYLAGLIGLVSALAGLLGAVILETTPGPAMAVTATIFYLIAALVSPGKGLISRIIQKRQLKNRILQEDIMKQALRLHQMGKLSLEKLYDLVDNRPRKLTSQVNNLVMQGMMTKSNRNISLTPKGIDEANRLIRAHRLWETYLVNQLGLSEEHIHEEAEKYEHLLTEEMIDEVDKTLGFPTQDPHGSPIPSKVGNPDHSLWQTEPGTSITISSDQPSQTAVFDLWRLGLIPGQRISLESKSDHSVTIRFSEKMITIKKDIARKVNVS